MNALAVAVVCLAGLWIIWTGLGMLVEPQRMRALLATMASSARINLVEQALRGLFGAALMVRADAARFPDLFLYGGAFVVVTSLALLVCPLAWHSAYAVWWSRRLKPWAVRLLAPVAIGLGGLLIWAAL